MKCSAGNLVVFKQQDHRLRRLGQSQVVDGFLQRQFAKPGFANWRAWRCIRCARLLGLKLQKRGRRYQRCPVFGNEGLNGLPRWRGVTGKFV